MNNLAGILSDKSDYAKAEELYKKSLNLNKKIYGNEHPEVVTNLSNLGVMYNHWGKLSQAEPLLKSALDMRIKLLGKNHPNAVTSLNIYASLLTSKKKYDEAVKQYRKSLSLRIEILGENHNLLDKKGRDDRLTNSTLRMLIKNCEFWGKENQAQECHEMLRAMDL